MAVEPTGFAARLQGDWFRPRLTPLTALLLPWSWLFALLVALRRLSFRVGLRRRWRAPVPVVVVGNLLIGGTGKTPVVVALVEALRAAGRRPGIVLRGYRAARAGDAVLAVDADTPVAEAGDEALLLARRCGVPVMVGRKRPAAVAALCAAHPEVDLVLSDDGLQHYALDRDVEIAVFDRRGIGNGRLLPAGPLREAVGRLASVDAIVVHADGAGAIGPIAGTVPVTTLRLRGERWFNVARPDESRQAADFVGQRCYAIAGIGAPQRFFDMLAASGIECDRCVAFADHHRYVAADVAFARDGVLLMTEKDAVKFAPDFHADAWMLPVTADFDDAGSRLLACILERVNGRAPA